MSDAEFDAIYRAAQLLRVGRANDAREELDRLIRGAGGDPPPDPQMKRVEREARAMA